MKIERSLISQRSSQLMSRIHGFALCVLCAVLLSPQALYAQSQSESNAQLNNAKIEKDLQNEFDDLMIQAYEGDREAQFKVGVLFTNNQFRVPDFEQAVYWYKQAARQDHVLAQYNLGHQYLTGVGVAKNDTLAMQWWMKAAKQEHALAQFNVGRAYYLGIGLEEDHKQSKYWFKRAAENNEPKSIDLLRQLGWASDSEIERYQLASQSQKPAKQPSITATTVVDSPEVSSSRTAAQTQERTVVAGSSSAQQTTTTLPSEDSIVLSTVLKKRDPIPEAASNAASTQAPSTGGGTAQQNAQSNTWTANASQLEPSSIDEVKSPVALYTNPAVRSVLITILDDHRLLNIQDKTKSWITVTSKQGFPVWIHGDFVRAQGSAGVVTGDSVNARSVPIITNGTVVGRFNNGEQLRIIGIRKEWYRVISPPRFKAWIKRDEYERQVELSLEAQQNRKLFSEADSADNNNGATPPSTLERNTVEDSVASVGRQASNLSTPSPSSNNSAATQPTPVVLASKAEERNVVSFDKPASNLSTPSPSSSGSINDNEWLFQQPPEYFTLQLASFDDPAKVREFISQSKFDNQADLHRFSSSGSNNILWTYFLYGSYKTKSEAQQSKINIKQKLAWVRTFGRLQQNRCISWKTKFPTPRELNRYCK